MTQDVLFLLSKLWSSYQKKDCVKARILHGYDVGSLFIYIVFCLFVSLLCR